MVLAIDAGNTRIKGAVFEQDTVLEALVFDPADFSGQLQAVFEKYPALTDVVVAAVGHLPENAFAGLPAQLRLTMVSHESRLPFANLYETPHTLGVDRLVLASGAVLAYPGKNRLVIDAGTCVTYDFIDDRDQYHGGAISPGLRLRYAALNQYTARLPLLEAQTPEGFVGHSTRESIHSGVVNGLAREIDGFIGQYREQYPNFIIILTGGDAEFLAKQLKNTIFAHSNFLLESLNRTFQYLNQK